MTRRIIAIEPIGKSGRARRLALSDGTHRTTSKSVVRELALSEGSDLADDASFSETLEGVERACARQRALRALSQRDLSATELVVRLADDGYPGHIAQEVVDALVLVGLVDDERFAEAWARSRVHQGFGRRRIAGDLARRGIPAELIAAAIDAACSDDEVERARSLLRGTVPHDRRQRERALRRLVSRGFELSVAIQAIDGNAAGHDPYDASTDTP